MILDSPDHKNYSIYKFKKSFLKKPQLSYPFTGLNGLVLEAFDKAELIADWLERLFTTNPGPKILDINESVNNIKNLKITK